MYKITVKYYDGTEKIFIEQEYDKACSKVNEYAHNAKSVHLKEIK